MKIFIANDHRGVSIKIYITNYLQQRGYEVVNLGTDTTDSVDYPVYAKTLCENVLSNKGSLGIAICATGIGVSIACNKIKGIRCAKVVNPIEAALARAHNDANVIALSSQTDYDIVAKILDEFIKTPFSEDERHIRRNKLINELENE